MASGDEVLSFLNTHVLSSCVSMSTPPHEFKLELRNGSNVDVITITRNFEPAATIGNGQFDMTKLYNIVITEA